MAEDFDAALARFAAGEEDLADTPEPGAPGAEKFSPGPCNTRSMSPASAGDKGERTADGGERNDDDDDDDLVDWDDEYAAETELVRIEMAMAADRPRDAPRITGFGPDGEPLDPDGRIADAQWQAFEQSVPRWWLVVPPVPEPVSEDGEEQGEWCYADEALIALALKAAEADDEDEEHEEDDGEREDDEDVWEDEDGADPAESADEAEGEEPDETGAKGDGAGGDGIEADAPADASSEAPPAAEPAPSPPPQETPRRWTYQIPPPNDGRCQPYYGRGW